MAIPTKPLLALLVTEFAFSSLATTSKMVVHEVHPLTVAAVRVVVGGIFLAAIALSVRKENLERRHVPLLVGLALLGVVFNQGLFLIAVRLTTATNATILITTIPVFTVLVAILFRKERAVPLRLLGIGVSVAGVAVLLGVENFDLGADTTLGNLLVIVNALSFSIYLVLSRPLLDRYRSTTVVMWTFLAAGLFLAPIGAATAADLDVGAVSTRAWLALAWVVLVGTVVAYSFNTYALKRLPPSTVAAFIFLQPLFGVALAMFLLGEELTARVIVGGLLILAGLAVVTRTDAVPVATDVGAPVTVDRGREEVHAASDDET